MSAKNARRGHITGLGRHLEHRDDGRVAKEFGDTVETTFLENVAEGPDAERSIEQLVRAGNKLIFTTSFGYMDPTLKVAKLMSVSSIAACPVTDQEGKTIECKGGDHLADGQILSMNFYVRGIDDKIPGE